MKVLSISDVITNSSDEVFLFRGNEAEYVREHFPDMDWVIFETMDDVKEWMEKASVDDLRWLSSLVPNNPLYEYNTETYEHRKLDKPWEEVKDAYAPLVGSIFLHVEEDPDDFRTSTCLRALGDDYGEWAHLG